VTLQSLKLPLTAYQLYAWALSADPANEAILTKTFSLGLNVLACPSKFGPAQQNNLSTHVLANLQAIALQYARLVVQGGGGRGFAFMLTTAWAAQTALWQLQWLPNDDPQRSAILPRLAESMAKRLLGDDSDNDEEPQSAEIQLLALRTLEYQSKWSDMLQVLAKSSDYSEDGNADETAASQSEFGIAMTRHQVLKEKARILQQLEQFDAAQTVYEILLQTNPDDWSCWKGHLECGVQANGEEGKSRTERLVASTIAKQEEAEMKYPLRAPHLMKVELVAHSIRQTETQETTKESIQALVDAIHAYAELFARRASCAFSDLEGYLELLLLEKTAIACKVEIIESLLEFAEKMRLSQTFKFEQEDNNKERQSKLRAYIFAARMTHKFLSKHADLQNRWMPNWNELVTEWQTSLTMSSSNEGEEASIIFMWCLRWICCCRLITLTAPRAFVSVCIWSIIYFLCFVLLCLQSQKETRPGDELLLLAVQQLLYCNNNNNDALVTAAVLLETAIDHSPHNAYLKFAAIDVYFQLDAMSRSWEFFQSIGIKHIQLDSCTFAIIPLLLSGGLYNETIVVCNALLRFQASTARDCGDYAGRAMEAGTLSKANEILVFQRERMNKSLTLLQAKGLILDSAALFAEGVPRKKLDEDPIHHGGLGTHQGIVGGESDFDRATQMVTEAHNPYAALSLVPWADQVGSVEEEWSDNRDFSMLSYQILYQTKRETKQEIVNDSLRRGHVHGLLIRASLVVEATKGPKKGKTVKSSDELSKRTTSLLECIETMSDFVEHNLSGTEALLMKTILDLSRILARFSAGLPTIEEENDTLEQREQHGADMMDQQATPNLQKAREQVSSSSSSSSSTMNVTTVCSLLSNYMVPLVAVFRMCATTFDKFGLGKRKLKTKRIAGSMANFASELAGITKIMLHSVEGLPTTETTSSATQLPKEYHQVLDERMLKETTALLTQAQHRTRMRIEPILKELLRELDSFDVTDV
jgi:N-terminal acetyltransferase B complex non-catalytic subunit